MLKKTYAFFGVGAVVLMFSSASVAALPWPAAAVQNLQYKIKHGACPAKPKDLLHQDICKTHGLTSVLSKTSTMSASQPNPSLIIIESKGQVVKLQRTEQPHEFMINQSQIDAFSAATHTDLKNKIQKILNPPQALFNLWIQSAFANPLNPEIPLLIQQLISDTNQSQTCDFYNEFGRQCIETLKKAKSEIANTRQIRDAARSDSGGVVKTKGEVTPPVPVIHLNVQLNQLQDRLDKNVFPSIVGYDTLRMCAASKTPNSINETARTTENDLNDCRKRLAELVKDTGGPTEIKQTESAFLNIYNRFFGGSKTRTAGGMPGGSASSDNSADGIR